MKNRSVPYPARQAIAGNDTSIPPEMITTISKIAKISVTSMERDRVITVDNPKKAGLTNEIKAERAIMT